jgi:hypothetical protein
MEVRKTMNDDTSSMDSFQSAPTDQEIARRVARWTIQRDELAALTSPTTDYQRLTWNILCNIGTLESNERLMFDKECTVAQEMLNRLQKLAVASDYLKRIKAVPFMAMPPMDQTHGLRRNLWLMTSAPTWLSSRDASTHDSLLWQFALVRSSCFLRTGTWMMPASTHA